jgi:hypothetical protein
MIVSTLKRWLAGEDGPKRTALPLGEFLHPAPLAAVLLLVLNDHVLKGSGVLPSWLTGKISDFCGVFFFPLLLTATFDVLVYGIAKLTRARLDFSLRKWKLFTAVTLTAGAMLTIELIPAAAEAYADATRSMGFGGAQSTPDPWDLAALIMLIPAWWLGCARIARVPLGRLEVIRREGNEHASELLADTRALRARAGEEGYIDELASALEAGDDEAAEKALAKIRD